MNNSPALPDMEVAVTFRMIVAGAIASRDWQPIHHDRDWAKANAGLRDVIMNNYTQAGWISRYVTDWCGPEGRIARLKFSMRRSICPGDRILFRGKITEIDASRDGMKFLTLDIRLLCGDQEVTRASVRLAMPGDLPGLSPWRLSAEDWRP